MQGYDVLARLRKEIRRHGVTERALARQMGMANSTLRHILDGRVPLTVRRLIDLSAALAALAALEGYSPSALMPPLRILAGEGRRVGARLPDEVASIKIDDLLALSRHSGIAPVTLVHALNAVYKPETAGV